MNGDVRLEGKKTTLQSFREEDAAQIVAWRNIPEVIQYLLNPRPLTMEDHLRWFYNSYLPDEDRIDFVVTEKESGRPAGTVGIKNMSSGCPEISYAIGALDLQGRGLAKDAFLTVVEYAKTKYGAKAAEACVHRDNAASQGFIEKLGFARGGKLAGSDDFFVYRREL